MQQPHTVSITVYPNPGQPPSNQVKNIPWFPGITVLEAMSIADSMDISDLRFRAVFASPYGAFIDSINDLADAGDSYWLLYINGTLSTLGASESILLEDDQISNIDIEWRYESVGHDHPLKAHIEAKRRAAGRV